jgi:hypothetical protein
LGLYFPPVAGVAERIGKIYIFTKPNPINSVFFVLVRKVGEALSESYEKKKAGFKLKLAGSQLLYF